MPSMMVAPEHMEFIEAQAKKREITKEEALDVVIRAGTHRINATANYLKAHKKPPKPRAPKAKAAPKPKKAKAPKSKKERPAAQQTVPPPTPEQAKVEVAKPSNGGDSMLE